METLAIFLRCKTQWYVGFSGRTGLNYNSVIEVMKFYDIKKKDRLAIFEQLQDMEMAALREWARA